MIRAALIGTAMLLLAGCDDDEDGKGGKVQGQAAITLSDGRVANITVVVTLTGLLFFGLRRQRA